MSSNSNAVFFLSRGKKESKIRVLRKTFFFSFFNPAWITETKMWWVNVFGLYPHCTQVSE